MATLITAAALLLATTHAYDFSGASGTNNSAPSFDTDVFLAANQAAAASHNVTFQHFHDDTDHAIDDTSIIFKDWTWTINASYVGLPADISDNITDAHATYITYSLQWPGNGDLNAALRAEVHASDDGRQEESCAYIFAAIFPPAVSAAWDPSSADCTSALGATCVKALMTQLGRVNGSSCSTRGLNLDDSSFLSACASSFGAPHTYWNDGVSTILLGNSSDSAANKTSLQQRDTFQWYLSAPQTPANASAVFANLSSALRVMAISRGSMDNVQLLCNRASSTSTSSTPLTGAASRVLGASTTPFIAVAAVVLAMLCL